MPISVLLISYLSLLWLCYKRMQSRREMLLIAAAWWTLSLIAITEILSRFGILSRWPLTFAWLALTSLVLVIASVSKLPVTGTKNERTRNYSRHDRLMLAAIVTIVAAVGITALVCPPNGEDQMEYHLPRILQWAERSSVAFFPTHYYAQLYLPPLAEWMMLDTYVLSGTDRFVSSVQWFAFIGCAIAVSLIARELGLRRSGQILAALISITIPQGILAASGAKNDYVLAFWLTTLLFFLIRLTASPSWLYTIGAGISLGAAFLTKGSAYLFSLPLALAMAVLFIRKGGTFRIALSRLSTIAVLCTLINYPQWSRNFELSGSFLGPPSPDVTGLLKYTVDRITLPGVAANVLRQLAIHFATPADWLNDRITTAVRRAVLTMGLSPDDASITRPIFSETQEIQEPHFLIRHSNRNEYFAGDPLHVALAIACFGMLFLPVRYGGPTARAIAIGVAGAFVLHCALFKWDWSCARIHLPLLVLAAPVIALILTERFPKAVFVIIFLLIAQAIPPALSNEIRPLLSAFPIRSDNGVRSILSRSRTDLYFEGESGLKTGFVAAAGAIGASHCTDVGIDSSSRSFPFDYPLAVLIKDKDPRIIVRYTGVHNLSRKFETDLDTRDPCAIVCLYCRGNESKQELYSLSHPHLQMFGNLVVFTTQVGDNAQ